MHRLYKVEIYTEGPFNHDLFPLSGKQADYAFVAGGDNAVTEPPFPHLQIASVSQSSCQLGKGTGE